MDGGLYYGDFIRNFDTRCQRSIVRIWSHFQGKEKDIIRTGVVIASTDRSCCVLTSSNIATNSKNIATNFNEVEFFDGTRAVVANTRHIRIRKPVQMAIILVINLDGIHWEVANFSPNEAILGQMVFTLGYNKDNAGSFNQTKEDGTTVTGNFISGSAVSRAGIQNDEFKDVAEFVHSCATGNNGHIGSAVFNETEMLVGLNFSCTTTKGVDYESDKPDGGLVCAIDLQTIHRGFELMYHNAAQVKNMSFTEIVQFLRAHIRIEEERVEDMHEG